MKGLFLTATLLIAAAVAVAEDAAKPCLDYTQQFTYDDGLTVAVDHGQSMTGWKFEGFKNPIRYVLDISRKVNNLCKVKHVNISTTVEPSTVVDISPYPRCVPDDATKVEKGWMFMNIDLDYLIYSDASPSQVLGRRVQANDGTLHKVTKWSKTITQNNLLDMPEICYADTVNV